MELRKPPSLLEEPVTAFPPGRIFQVISLGYGLMPSYAAELPVDDRWAMVAYLRALQLSQAAELAALPGDVRRGRREELAMTVASEAPPLDPSVLRPARPFRGEPRGAVRRPRGRRAGDGAAGRSGSSSTPSRSSFRTWSPTPTCSRWCSARGRSSWRCTPPAPSGRRPCGAWPRPSWRSCRSPSCSSSRSSWAPISSIPGCIPSGSPARRSDSGAAQAALT